MQLVCASVIELLQLAMKFSPIALRIVLRCASALIDRESASWSSTRWSRTCSHRRPLSDSLVLQPITRSTPTQNLPIASSIHERDREEKSFLDRDHEPIIAVGWFGTSRCLCANTPGLALLQAIPRDATPHSASRPGVGRGHSVGPSW
jgi:hypothetical protein